MVLLFTLYFYKQHEYSVQIVIIKKTNHIEILYFSTVKIFERSV